GQANDSISLGSSSSDQSGRQDQQANSRVKELVIERPAGGRKSYGFAIRTFRILTAGLLPGHVLISVNNFSVEAVEHRLIEDEFAAATSGWCFEFGSRMLPSEWNWPGEL
uniref:MATH domain-containing protein n=1 Tax=Macrostomum lignano TaxID=282301 RepID=A0A1I8F3T6_9PLAT